MKLIDCFMYFDEDLVLDIRLNTLNEKVDKIKYLVVEELPVKKIIFLFLEKSAILVKRKFSKKFYMRDLKTQMIMI